MVSCSLLFTNLKQVFDEPRAHWHFSSSNLCVYVLGTSNFNAGDKEAVASKDGQTVKSACETASEAHATVRFFICVYFRYSCG
jgi:hypothetical protein